ncbi:hypothetical protein LTR36_000821 [Oleoguttula mirabilis]|uniref:Uncharacterized protein n=1 Tax=Oleoguttula mirabilis TaxID=1507867 RepID=A0AAV9J408_9PEZI|nr:hypothetical protein LTR36_000821 [Oleoguttula mirabilis]
MEAASSSKVTVEFHDPSGVFPLVSRDIAARLPLRNLNWQSQARPLRQIRQLHVEFVPDQFTETSLRPPVERADSNGPNSFDIVRSGRDQRKDAVKERRHQIPGLKTSPYLKVYVLRCDDKDTYKATERNKIRQWVRESAQADGKRGEKHEAFEWLIVHVVIPDTVTASEPRWRESQSEPDMLKERKTSNMKLPGKSSKTVFDRLRADFNESGKGSQDRIAQVRVLKKDVPPDLLPTPAVAETLAETPQERENAWKDLMDKFKILILGPFDARVRQYEADVAEQESRRSLPGWNFCTFFIHKEGLAKALESIGLVEDALAIYDELSLGLETVVRDLASGKAGGTATTFATHTDDIEARVLGTAKTLGNGSTGHEVDVKRAAKKLDLFGKDYREQIVRSNISVFDFFCYLFLRQKALILRLANTQAARAEMGSTAAKDGGEDLVLTSEVCWRASSFIHNNARTLRQDLANGSKQYSLSDIEALVCSWSYAVADHVLAETAASVLDLTESGEKVLTNGIHGPKRADFGFGLGANPYPQRSSSLAIRKALPELQRPPSTVGGSTFSPPSSSGKDAATPKAAGIPGLPELATYRAELVMMQRKMLEQLAEGRGWRAGWAAVRYDKASRLQEVKLDEETNGSAVREDSDGATTSRMLTASLALALTSGADFQDAYQLLSDQAMRYYALATQTNSVQGIVGDLALLKRQQGEYEAAESFLKHLLPSYATEGWSAMEVEILDVYAECLKVLGRREDYVKTVLDVLAKSCQRKMTRKVLALRLPLNDFDDDDVDATGMLRDLVHYSKGLEREVTRPTEGYFTELEVEKEVKHFEDRDGFSLHLRIQHLLDDEIELDAVSTRLVSVADPSQEIWLVSGGSVMLTPGSVEVDVTSTTTAFGAYFVDKVILKAGKLRFVQELQPKPDTPALVLNDAEAPVAHSMSYKRPYVLLYPAAHSLDVEVSVVKDVHIDKPRHLIIAISSGLNQIEDIDLKLKPTSAGLRLHLADAKYAEDAQQRQSEGVAGQLHLGSLAEHSSATVKVPYTIEQATKDISMRLEVRYHTSNGAFSFFRSIVLRHELPLDVDVDDIFHLDTLFSNFTVRTTNKVPVVIMKATLEDSPVYAVESPPAAGMPMTVFDRSSARLTYKIARKSSNGGKLVNRDAALALKMQYLPADEFLAMAVRTRFTEDLQSSIYQSVACLLVPILAERCKQLFSIADVEIAVMLELAKVPSYEDFGWQEVIDTLPRVVQLELADWLKGWHSEHEHLKLHLQSSVAEEALRHITISVDVPVVDFVHSASLSLLWIRQRNDHGPHVLTVGHPVKARASIQHTGKWSAASIFNNPKTKTAHPSFVMDVQAESDTWILGGQHRAHFTPSEGEATAFELTLIPLKAGHHSLPTVDIQPEPVVPADGRGDQTRQPDVSCETHYTSSGQTVHVTRDLRTARIHIEDTPVSAAALPSATEPG